MMNKQTEYMDKKLYERINSEIWRLWWLKLKWWEDILSPSGRSEDDIFEIISRVRSAHLKKWWEIDDEYNIPWMVQALLKKWSKEKDLRVDTPGDILYKANPKIILPISRYDFANYLVSQLPDRLLFNWFVHNIDEVCYVMEQMRESITSGKNILILSNHATWFNLPLIAHCLHRIFGIPQQDIYTIIGPAITHSHWNLSGITRVSNVVKTNASTERGNTGYSGTGQIRKNFFAKIISILESDRDRESPRIILLAPSGTTDRVTPDGTIDMKEPSKWTENLIRCLIDRFRLIGVAIGVNDTQIIPSWHSRPQKWNVYVGVSPIDTTNWKKVLANSVQDASGKAIGIWIPPTRKDNKEIEK